MPDGEGGADLMSAAELKPLLMQSKRKPVSCAVGMTKDKQGVLLLDRKMKPRKLMAELKSKAKSGGMDLDTVSVRFGRVAVGADDGTAVFTVNKAAPAALRMKLVEKLRPAGVRKVEMGVDESLEDESDEDEAGAGKADGAGAAGGAGAAEGADTSGGAAGGAQAGAEVAADATPDGAAGPGDATAPATASMGEDGEDAAAAPTGDGDAGAAGASPGPAAGAPGKAGVARRLAGLVQRMAPGLALASNADAMRAAAVAGHKAVQSGDIAGAGEAADKLEGMLGGAEDGKADAPAGIGMAASPADGAGAASTQNQAAMAGDDGASGVAAGGSVPEPSNGAGGSQPSQATARTPNGKLFSKGGEIWTAVRTKLEGDIHALLAAVAAEPGVDKGMVQQIQSHVEPIIKQLDDSLAKKLAEIAEASGGGHDKLVQEAEGIMDRYRAFVDGEPMIGILDQNPIKPVAIRKTLDQALTSLAKVLATAKTSGPEARA